MPSLSFTQHEIAVEKGFSKLSDFDLAALLRIANKSWYDLQTVIFLPSYERETIRKMIDVRNNWAHCSTELPGKDIILQDLNTLLAFMEQFDGDKYSFDEINRFIDFIEQPDSLNLEPSPIESKDSVEVTESSNEATASIQENSLVYLVSDPKINGVVLSLKDLGDITQYNVFINNEIKQYYTGQIALVKRSVGYNWISLSEMRSYLTAYQINNPSSQNLYSLNSARIDFVPYQFRPALKMIHADEPRILIADSVGVGKTIEAGLIIKELEARSDLERVLVICPKPLVAERKWELEMKRFDEEFIPIDGTALRQIISDTDRDGDWPVRYNKAIIPYSILDSKVYKGESGRRNRIFGLSELDPEPHFDLVIVDEAHHIRNGSDDKEKAFAYKCTKYFCDHADAVVMLTATPLQTSDNDLFTLLNVLRPDIVVDKNTFDMMSRPNANISRAVHLVRAMEEGWNEKATTELLASHIKKLCKTPVRIITVEEMCKVQKIKTHDNRIYPYDRSYSRNIILNTYSPEGSRDLCFCQMCLKPKPKVYIEVNSIDILPEFFFSQLRLSLCLECSKRFEALRRNEPIRRAFIKCIKEYVISDEGTVEIPIGNFDTITFTAKHLAEIQEILRQIPTKTK